MSGVVLICMSDCVETLHYQVQARLVGQTVCASPPKTRCDLKHASPSDWAMPVSCAPCLLYIGPEGALQAAEAVKGLLELGSFGPGFGILSHAVEYQILHCLAGILRNPACGSP